MLIFAGIPSQFHLHRLQAAFELFAVLLAGWGVERAVSAAMRFPGLLTVAAGALVGAGILFLAMERTDFLHLNTQWGETNLAAYEHERGDLEAAMADVRTILAERAGRVSAGKAAEWGGTFKIGDTQVYSFFSSSGFDTASYLYHTISLTSDYMVLRDENDPVQENFFGIRAVVAPVSLKLPPYFHRRSVHGRFAVYEASPEGYFGLVDIAASYDGSKATWYDPILNWLHSPMMHAGEEVALDPDFSGVPVLTRWQQMPAPAPQFMSPRGRVLTESKVDEIYRATIDVQRPCYGLIKITYFPNLVVTVDGNSERLIRVFPDFGAFALTPGHHEVEVRYEPGPLKFLLFLAGIALFVLLTRPAYAAAWKRWQDWLEERLGALGAWLSGERVKTAFMLALLILLFTRGLFRGQLMDGHDATEYPPRLTEFAKILGEGVFPPIWAPDLSAGHGQPLFEFAPPLAYLAALPFHELGLGIADSYQFGLFVLLAMGAIAFYLLGRQLSFSRLASLGATAAWLFAPYHAIDVYVSTRFAEASAVAIVPLALLGLVVALQRPTFLSVAAAALAIALVPLGHNAIALLMFPVFALIIVERAAVSDRPVRTAVAGAGALAGGLGLSAFFWLPALMEKDFVKTALLRSDFLNWSVHIISPWQLLWGRWGFGFSVAGPNDGMSFALGFVHIALAIAGIVIGVRALNRTRRVDAIVFAAAAIGGALLATEWTSIVWAHVATLQYLAYPWRTLCVPALFGSLLALYAFDRLGKKASLVAILVIVLVNITHTQPKGYLTFDEEFYAPDSVAQKGLNTTTREEYESRWVNQRMPYTGIGMMNSPLWDTVRILSWTSTSHELAVVTKGPMTAVDETTYYPGWTVLVDGNETAATAEPTYGLISFKVPAGSHDIKVELRPTTVRRLGPLISQLTLVLLLLGVAVAYIERRWKLLPRALSREPSIEPEAGPAKRASAGSGHSFAGELDELAKANPGTSTKLTRAVGIALLLAFLGQGAMFIRANSQTFDESIHLEAGYSYLATRQIRLDPQHTPLVLELAALPVYLWYRLPFKPNPQIWNLPQRYLFANLLDLWGFAADFLYHSSVPADRILTLSRIPNLLLGAILVALVGWWSYRLWGPTAGILGMWLAAFDPNLVAHSSLVTTDLGATLFSFLTVYLLWEYTACPTIWMLLATGISLGLALVSKYTCVLLLGILPLMMVPIGLPLPRSKLTDRARSFSGKLLEGLLAAVVILALAMLVISIVYFGFRQGFATWIAGFQDVVSLQGEGKPAFLMGQFSSQGWWSYFPVTVLVKTPVGTLCLIFAALALFRKGVPLRRKDAIFLLVPALAFFAIASYGKLDIGLRHVLLIYPFLFVLASRIATVSFRRAWIAPLLCALPLLLTTVSSLRVAPHDSLTSTNSSAVPAMATAT